MEDLQKLINPYTGSGNRNLWISAYDERPSSLFEGVDQRLIIKLFSSVEKDAELFTTRINRWYSDNRELLFETIYHEYLPATKYPKYSKIIKINDSKVEFSILDKFLKNKSIAIYVSEKKTENKLVYRTAGGRYWKVFNDTEAEKKTLSEKIAYLSNLNDRVAIAVLSSSTFWWYYSSHFDMFNLKDYMIFGFRFSNSSNETSRKLKSLGEKYLNDLEDNSVSQIINSSTRGKVNQKIYYVKKSKPIIDNIDKALADHYSFNPEELDYIINYDIKYRMGSELED